MLVYVKCDDIGLVPERGEGRGYQREERGGGICRRHEVEHFHLPNTRAVYWSPGGERFAI